MLLGTFCKIKIPVDPPEEVLFALRALSQDLSDVFGIQPEMAADTVLPDIIIECNDGTEETFCIKSTSRNITISGSSPLGTVFGIYDFSERILGIDPFKFWTDFKVKQQTQIDTGIFDFISAPPAVRFRGWFINGEDCLTGWHDNMTISPATWEIIFETLLRNKFNMIIPGTGIKPDAPQLEQASKMGLWIAQHHAEPLGAEMFSNVYPGIAPKYLEDFDKFVKLYEDSITCHKNQKVIWSLGFRGQGDHAFYEDDPRYADPEKAGKVLSDIIRFQKKLICEKVSGPKCFAHNLYGESASLYKQGYLELDDDIIRIWGDNGFGAMRVRRRGIGHPEMHESSMPPQKDKDKSWGIYYHVNFHDLEISNQLTPLPAPELIAKEFAKLMSYGKMDFLLLNIGNIRPHVFTAETVRKMTEQYIFSTHFDWETAVQNCYKEFTSKHFPSFAQQAENVLKSYFASPFSFGKYPDQKAGEEVYHYTLRTAILAVLQNKPEWSNTGFASDFPKEKELRFAALKNLAASSLPAWRSTLEAAEKLAAEYPDNIYFDHSILAHTQIMYYSCLGYVDGLDALLCYLEKNYKAAFTGFYKAKKAMIEAEKVLNRLSHGKWQNFYRGDWLSCISETIQYLHTMQGTCRILGDPGKSAWANEVMNLTHYNFNIVNNAHPDWDILAEAMLEKSETKDNYSVITGKKEK